MVCKLLLHVNYLNLRYKNPADYYAFMLYSKWEQICSLGKHLYHSVKQLKGNYLFN